MRQRPHLFEHGPLALLALGTPYTGLRGWSAILDGASLVGGLFLLAGLLLLLLAGSAWACLHPAPTQPLVEPDWGLFNSELDRHRWTHLREQFAHGQIGLVELESRLGEMLGIPTSPAGPFRAPAIAEPPARVGTQRGRLSPLAS